MSEWPECEKLAAVADKSHTCGEFIDWLRDEHNICLARWAPTEADQVLNRMMDRYARPEKEELLQCFIPIEKLLAGFFQIDMDKVETERRAMLKQIREQKIKEEV
jgi:hypothetical protein